MLCFRPPAVAASRQPYRKLRIRTQFAVYLDCAAVLLRYDVVAYREPESSAFSGRFRSNERLEQFIADLRRDPRAVVTNPDHDLVTQIARRDSQHGTIPIGSFPVALVGGVEAVADEVEEHAGDLLRHDINGCEIAVEVVLQCDVKVRILRTGSVIGEVESFLGERVEIGSLPIVAASTRVLQHASDNTVGAAAVLDDLLHVSSQHADCLDNLGAFVGIKRADRTRCFLQLVQ